MNTLKRGSMVWVFGLACLGLLLSSPVVAQQDEELADKRDNDVAAVTGKNMDEVLTSEQMREYYTTFHSLYHNQRQFRDEFVNRTNQGKGELDSAGDKDYDATYTPMALRAELDPEFAAHDWWTMDYHWRMLDSEWRASDLYWRDPARASDPMAKEYWKTSDEYWKTSRDYWTESRRINDSIYRDAMASRTNQGKGTPQQEEDKLREQGPRERN